MPTRVADTPSEHVPAAATSAPCEPQGFADFSDAGAISAPGTVTDTTVTDTAAAGPAADSGPDAVVVTEDELAAQLRGDARRIRILTGDRPTGPLHLGHYLGSLRNRVRLQDQGADLQVLVADYQVITDRDGTGRITDHALGLVADYLAVGIDPARATVFAHSAVPALNQLLLPFLSLVSVPELERNPTTKAEAAASGRSALSALLLTYPLHQAADILFCRADLVPVGRDQLPHLEVTRTVARRFNTRYAPVFIEPRALISAAPSVLGADGAKMSKSRGNTIPLAATADETARALKGFKTDSDRRIGFDPDARPEVANLLLMTALCRGGEHTPESVAAEIGDRGAAALKAAAIEAVNEHLRPIRARRAQALGEPGELRAILRRGAERANAEAEQTLRQVREVMGMNY